MPAVPLPAVPLPAVPLPAVEEESTEPVRVALPLPAMELDDAMPVGLGEQFLAAMAAIERKRESRRARGIEG